MTGTINALCFFVGTLAVYYIIPERFRWGILLFASILFYLCADYRMIAVIAVSVLFSWFVGMRMEQAKEKKRWLIFGIAVMVAVLAVFK